MASGRRRRGLLRRLLAAALVQIPAVVGGRRPGAARAGRRGAGGRSPAGGRGGRSSWSARWPSCCELPGWVAGLSPYSHVPKVPAEALRLGPELALTAIAAALLATAWWRYRSVTSASVRGMWEPDPAWHPVSGGTGTSTVGVWRTDRRPSLVVKRLGAPAPRRPAGAPRPAPLRLLAPRGRRRGQRRRRRDPRAARRRRSTSPRTTRASPSPASGWRTPRSTGLRRARDGPVRRRRPGPARWLAVDQLRDRMARVERRGGWPTLARTTVADVADRLWTGARRCCASSTPCRRCRSTATPRPRNLPGRDGRRRRRRSTGARSGTGRSVPTWASSSRAPARRPSRCSTPT